MDILRYSASTLAKAIVAMCDDEPFNLAISGGSSLVPLFKELYKNPICDEVENELNFFWVDERCVPIDSEQSNYGEAYRHWLKSERDVSIFKMFTANQDPQECAEKYATTLQRRCNSSLDLIIMGMGEDGHIASIFPEHDEAEEDVFICNHPTDGTTRISLNFDILQRAKQVWLVVSNEKKKDLLINQGDLPVHRLLEVANVKIIELGG